jgi:pentatricopeptide repeat protein
MTTGTDLNSYPRGLKLAEAGKHVEALNCIQEHLRSAPNDVDALNDAGAVLHCLGRHKEAIDYLTRARHLRADSGEVVWNLVEAYLAAGRPSEAASLFDAMQQMGILNVDVLNRTATQLLDRDMKGQAIDTLLRSYHLWPEQDVLKSMVDIIRSKRPKITCFRMRHGPDDSLSDVWTFVQERFQTECFDRFSQEEMAGRMPQQGIVWFDGGGPLLVAACKDQSPRKTIVSLRRSDIHGDWMQQVRWENVDILVQIGSSAVEEALVGYVPDIRNRTRLVVLPYAVNMDRYVLRQRPLGRNLACMGRFSMESNPGFLVHCMQKLHYMDGRYRLFFAGTFEDPILEQYVHHVVKTLSLSDVVFFEPCPDDVNAWFSDQHFIVSSGMSDGQVETVLAGMATGLKPVVHNFPAASHLLPGECLFDISEQFCQRVLGADYDPARYRRCVEERYPMQAQIRQVSGILAQLETEIELESPSGFVGQPICIPSFPVQQDREPAAPAMAGMAQL